MTKLLKEAQRVKQVLSANTDHYAQVVSYLLPKKLSECFYMYHHVLTLDNKVKLGRATYVSLQVN